MKSQILKMSGIIFATAVIGIGSATWARADERIAARVPFAFIVGETRLPAGDYVVREMSDGSGALGIASADGKQFVCALTIPSPSDTRAAQPELVFEKFRDHYFLARVVPQIGEEHDLVLTPSTMRREIARTADHAGD